MTVSVITLDNRKLNLHISEVVNPHYVKVIRGEGMPVSKYPGQKGDMKIKFDIKFPRIVTDEKKNQLKQILG